LLTVVILWFGVDRAMLPLSKLRDEVKRRSSLDLSPLPEDDVVAEIRPLIHGFNELLGRLDASFALKRRFVADAAHQLRTPLTGLKAQAELALSLQNEEDIRHSLIQIRKAADHASHLANQLLLLARSEPGSQDQMRELDFIALAKATTEAWVPAALHKNIDLGFEFSGVNGRMLGNATLLGELLNNLLDNAIRYTPDAGRVTARVNVSGDKVALEVEDDGLGVPEAERDRVFERFYRVLGTNQDGCGLGLAIVREIAYQHNAKLSLQSGSNGQGTLIRVVFTRSPNLDVGELSGSYHVVY
ncbi:MAG: ATP-binding protein, partial [Gallionella sp.]|nr:ATP-binding protein [Gallionella sp.]